MSKLDDLMYQSGMTAQGCWDEMDSYQQEAIMKLSKLIANECIHILVQNRKYAVDKKWSVQELANVCLYEIEKTFEVNKDGKETVSG